MSAWHLTWCPVKLSKREFTPSRLVGMGIFAQHCQWEISRVPEAAASEDAGPPHCHLMPWLCRASREGGTWKAACAPSHREHACPCVALRKETWSGQGTCGEVVLAAWLHRSGAHRCVWVWESGQPTDPHPEDTLASWDASAVPFDAVCSCVEWRW